MGTDVMSMSDAKTEAVDDGVFIGIQRFLYREAGLLDRREYHKWLSLLTDDVRYRVTAAVARDAGASARDYAIIDERMTGLRSRIDQISNPRLTRAENPPSMMRRVVSNIEAHHAEGSGDVAVESYLLAYRSRPGVPEGGFYVAVRRDTLRRSDGDWRLARRTVQLDHLVLFDGALSALL
jgi:3-phenylpropionate/cinnamic acid dioxygenase small subunit